MSDPEVDPAVKKAIEHRKFVLIEFVDSEREYVERLRATVEGYLDYIKAGGPDILPSLKTDILSIFSTLPDIYTFHKDVLFPALQQHNTEDAEAMVGVFIKHGSEFTSKYVAYCKNKPVSDSTRVEYDSFFSQRQSALGQKLNIEDLLIAPVQRLPRYQLLIRDLLKDTKKAKLDTTKIEEALELMQRIPKETNNIICMSLLRGVSRASVISHGSLWRQDTLLFSTAGNGSKEDTVQVYLFDHQILVAATADEDGFYHFKLGIKTLNGKVGENGDPLKFTFTASEGGAMYRFKAERKEITENWITDLRSILTSQSQMRKALVFGKSATPKVNRTVSVGMEWSDSDSSIDSMPESDPDSDLEGDWPQETGFQSVTPRTLPKSSPLLRITKPDKVKKGKKKKEAIPDKIRRATSPNSFLFKSSSPTLSLGDRPHSFHVASVAEFDQTLQKRSESLSVSPRMLRRWLVQKSSSGNTAMTRIYYPNSAHSFNPPRSPGAFRKPSRPVEPSPQDVYYIAVEDRPARAEQVYSPPPGQVLLPGDVSHGDVWQATVLSGNNSGEEVWVQRNTLEEYTAPILLKSIKKSYSIMNHIARGRFSEVKQARLKLNKKVVAIKILKEGTTEEQFFRELCITSRLKHTNLVGCHCGVQNGEMAIVLENINGRPLLDYLSRKPCVTETMVAELMEQLLDGLNYIHSHTIMHLDVRPGNVMIQVSRKMDILKLIDFGAARHYGDVSLGLHVEPNCDYQYVAPEVFQQEPLGPGTDMWGVGVIIYTIFYGANPFNGGSNLHTIANITGLRYSIPSPHNPACSDEAISLIKDIFVLSNRSRPSAESAKSYSWFKIAQSLQHNKVDLAQLKRFVCVSHS